MLLDINQHKTDTGFDPKLPFSPKGFQERFGIEFDVSHAPDRHVFYEMAMYDKYEKSIEEHFRATGNRLPNPYALERGFDPLAMATMTLLMPGEMAGARLKSQDEIRADTDAALIKSRAEHPSIPDPSLFDAQVSEAAKEIRKRSQEAALTSVGFGGTGAFLGAMSGEMTHPIQLATLPLGYTGGARAAMGVKAAMTRILTAGGVEAGVAGSTEALIQALDDPIRSRLGTRATSDEVLFNILAATGGGFLFGSGIRSLVEGGRAVFAKGAPTQEEKGLFRQAELDLHAQETSPYGRSGMMEHATALNEAVETVRRGNRAPAGVDAPPLKVEGSERVFTASGRAVDVEFEVVEAKSLITSHGQDLRENAAYIKELQPRQRERAASEAQVQEIAANLEPDRLGSGSEAGSGAPIVGPDNVVESGNGRTLSIQRAYEQDLGTAKKYRTWLGKQGYNVSKFEQPVLVRRRITGMNNDERIAFAREANQSVTLTMGAAERAMSDAGLIAGKFDLYKGGEIDTAANRDFVRSFVKELPSSERGEILSESGQLSQAGKRRIEGALLARAYNDADLIHKLTESKDNNIKSIGGALLDTAAAWAQMRERAAAGLIDQKMDVTADLLAAVHMVEHARAKGVKVFDIASQGDLMGGGLTDTARAFLASMYRDPNFMRPLSRKALAERLGGYVDEANKTRPGANMFGEMAPNPREILAATDKQGSLLPPDAHKQTQISEGADATARAMDMEEADDALILEAQRVAAEMDPDVPLDEGSIKASDLLEEAAERRRVADEIADACMVGRAAE